MKNTIKNFIVQNDEIQNDMLRNKLFDVNIRLFRSNKKHRNLILNIVNYMEKVAKKKFRDYTPARGISAANVGIPFNIIGVKSDRKWNFFLNPKYIETSLKKKWVKSNCGSLLLEKPIEIERYVWVKISYYNLKGVLCVKRFKDSYGCTIQHELEHNQGILIIDKKRNDAPMA